MNKDVKAKWVGALREPDRTQRRLVLEVEGEGQCCLGVLCEIAAKEGVVERVSKGEGSAVMYGGSHKVLPDAVIAWAGLPAQPNPQVHVPALGGAHGLAHLNDVEGYTFSQIADVVEENF